MRGMAWGAAAMAAVALAGCGSSGKSSGGGGGQATATPTPTSTSSSSSSAAAGGGTPVAIAADASGALKFTKSTLKAKSGTVTFEFSNPSQVPHAFAVEGHGVDKDSKVITGGKTTLTVDLKPGKYEFYCPYDSHKQMGMEGTLTVK